jgi:hypothetical protein
MECRKLTVSRTLFTAIKSRCLKIFASLAQ